VANEDPEDPVLAEIKRTRERLLAKLREVDEIEKEHVGEPSDVRPLVALKDALEEVDPEPDWIIESLLPAGGTAVLSAPGGTGKSTLLVQILATLATGAEVFGFNVPKARRCAFLQCEGSRRIFKNRVQVAIGNLGYDVGLPLLIPSRTFTPPLFVSPEFERLLLEEKAEVCVCDTVGYFFDGDENSNSDVKRLVMRPLSAMGGRTQIATILVHHYGKPSEFRTGRHKTRGASAWIDDVDLAMRLEELEGGGKQDLVLHFDKIKHGPPRDPIRLHYEPSQAMFTMNADGMPETAAPDVAREEKNLVAIGKAKESVLKELKKASFSPEGGMTRRQLREVVTGRPGTVDEAVQELYRATEIYHEPSAKRSDVQVWKVYALPQAKT
jgi:RecA-family ATPase